MYLFDLAIGYFLQLAIRLLWRSTKRLWRKHGFQVVSMPTWKTIHKKVEEQEIELVRRDLQIEELRETLAATLTSGSTVSEPNSITRRTFGRGESKKGVDDGRLNPR